jgi:hypothetical protein
VFETLAYGQVEMLHKAEDLEKTLKPKLTVQNYEQ